MAITEVNTSEQNTTEQNTTIDLNVIDNLSMNLEGTVQDNACPGL